MAIIIDRRTTANRDRTSENRGRLLRRYKSAIKEQLPRILGDRKLLDNVRGGGGKVVIPKKSLSEPQFVYGDGGLKDTVLPGNDRWHEYDTIDKPQDGEDEGGAGDGPDGLDEFSIVLSREEFLKILFDDCELPFMVDTLVQKQAEITHENAGFQVAGSPNRLSIIRSYKNSKARRLSSSSALTEEIATLEQEIEDIFEAVRDTPGNGGQPSEAQKERLAELATKIGELKIRKSILPLFDTTDLRFRTRVEKKLPKTHATMIMIMDNSGSMGEREKTIARKFFILLYLFLAQNYDKIDMRFISHTTTAKEMNEEEFFDTHENGGTIVSSALDLLVKMLAGEDTVGTPDELKNTGELKGRTNIYVAQVSDGDNTDTDNGTCSELLSDDILPFVNYFAYVQVEQESNPLGGLLSYSRRNSLWATYEAISKNHPNHVSKRVTHERDIFGVFRSFFSTQT